MAASQLPSIDDQLVTPDNPPRTDLNGMDHARCAALHNYLVDLCLAADADSQTDPAAADTQGRRATYFSTHGDAAEAVRSRLHPSLAAFLAAACTPDAPLFYFVDGMPDPDDGDFNSLFDNETADNEDEPEDSIVRLYFSHMDACDGEQGGGMLYHQHRHLASFFVHPDDTDFAFPVDEHPQSWHPLETIFSNWIDLIRLGKVAISPTGEQARYGGVKIGNWEWRPYGDGQVAGCVAAWHRLCDAIEVRRQQSRGANTVSDHDDNSPPPPSDDEPLLTPAAMDAAQIPDPSFARAFMGLARRPRHIRQIAPGLSLPPADAAAFAAGQPFIHLPRRVAQWDGSAREGIVPPCTSSGATRALHPSMTWRVGIHRSATTGPTGMAPSRTASRSRRAAACRRGSTATVWGNPNRPQRLERLLDHWAGLVERGIWSVGPHGVQGSIDVFKDAKVDWASYAISSSW
ncbi:uncharacterized protein PG998_013306 [Apiospora kogelbergensis]|uniref:uncharacterized protein n=1 Tax=Apiospora kogelbergensis TaxID=1337665 RepID=UPI00312E9412